MITTPKMIMPAITVLGYCI